MYMYIYIHMHVCMYIYIYTYACNLHILKNRVGVARLGKPLGTIQAHSILGIIGFGFGFGLRSYNVSYPSKSQGVWYKLTENPQGPPKISPERVDDFHT